MKTDDRVEFDLCGEKDSGIGKGSGIILGLSADFPTGKFWIVLLDEPISDERGLWKAISIPEACMLKISVNRDRYFRIGDKVITTKDAGRDDWYDPGVRCWGVKGTIIDRSDAHGLCFKVAYDKVAYGGDFDVIIDAWFDHDELELDNG